MGQDIGSKTRGYAWFVYPDQATPGALVRDNPFGVDPLADESTAPGVEVFWAIGETAAGIRNRAMGRSYLALTETLDPPQIGPGWIVEPARLDDGFRIEQRGARWVRLTRVLGRRESMLGTIQDCEFEIDWT
jgi:hypothetical protein